MHAKALTHYAIQDSKSKNEITAQNDPSGLMLYW